MLYSPVANDRLFGTSRSTIPPASISEVDTNSEETTKGAVAVAVDKDT